MHCVILPPTAVSEKTISYCLCTCGVLGRRHQMVLSAVAFCGSQTPLTCGVTLGPVVCGQGMMQ